MQQIEEKFSKLQLERNGSLQKLTWIESEILEMKNNQDLDNTVRQRFLNLLKIKDMYFQLMNFNTQVCNASIQALRYEVHDMFKIREDDTNTENNVSSHEKFSDFDEDSSLDIFEEFDKALAEYEEDLMTKETENSNIVIPESGFSLTIACFDAKNIFL